MEEKSETGWEHSLNYKYKERIQAISLGQNARHSLLVKYRRKVITEQIEKSLFEILTKIVQYNKFRILEFNTDKDHVPQNYIPDMLKALKGVSARLLMKKYGNELRKQLLGGHLWNPSYFIATVSENTEQQVRDYIKKQKEK